MTPRLRFPHPLTLLLGCILLAAVLSWVLPAGAYERRLGPVTGRTTVVPGSYERVAPQPVGPFEALVAIPRGLADAADIVFLVFLVGGAFTVVETTGAFHTGLAGLRRLLGGRALLAVPLACLAFAAGGALFNMQEEIIALIPVLLLLTTGLGVSAVVAVAMSLGSAAVGAAFSPINPFQVGIAQQVAELPLLSGGLYRTAFLVLAVAIWTWGTLRLALRTRTDANGPVQALAAGDPAPQASHGAILALVGATFAVYVFGVLRLDWGFDEMSALFFLMGLLAGLLGGLRVEGTVRAYVDGFRAMAFAALLIGFARAIFVVLDDGRIVDTIVHSLFQPIETLPATAAALGIMAVQTLVHVPVPSASGQAVLTMPILVPLSDLIGVTRQVTVLATQYGSGLCDMITPTNGALMAIIAAAGVRYDQWLRFALPLWALLLGLGGVAVALATMVGLR